MNDQYSCPGCGASAPTEEPLDKCHYCGRRRVIDSLSDIIKSKNKILRSFIASALADGGIGRPNPNTLFSIGLAQLKLELFKEAIANLGECVRYDPENHAARYYLALAMLKKRVPRELTDENFKLVDTYLKSAIESDKTKAHYYYLWAIIKWDYYTDRWESIPRPEPGELIDDAMAAERDETEIKLMLEFAPVNDNILRSRILNSTPEVEYEDDIGERIGHYFISVPIPAVISIVVGSIAAATGYFISINIMILSSLFIIAGLAGILFHLYIRPTDSEMDRLLFEQLEKLKNKIAPGKFTLDVSQLEDKPIVVYRADKTNKSFKIKKGKDGKQRYTPMFCSVLMFGHDQLLGLKCSYDLIRSKISSESTLEYFYCDIVSASTAMEEVAVEDKRGEAKTVEVEKFTITASSGDNFSFYLKDPEVKKLDKKDKIWEAFDIEAVPTIRNQLRNKKKLIG